MLHWQSTIPVLNNTKVKKDNKNIQKNGAKFNYSLTIDYHKLSK